MFYILHGQDDFSLHQSLEKIKGGLGDPEMLAVNTSSLDSPPLTLNELQNTCNAVPFLFSYRLVVVNGLLQNFEPRKDKSRAQKGTTKSKNKLGEWQGMASYIRQMPVTTVLILVDENISGKNPLLRELSPLAEVRTFPLLKDKGLTEWIKQRVNEGGGKITPKSVNLLAELIGGNLWAMDNEVQKLLLYSREHSIRENDIGLLVSHAQEANIFLLVDAILEGKNGIAQRILYRLYQHGDSSAHILAMITRQFRLIAQIKELESGLSRMQLQDRLGLKSMYILDKTLAQAKLYSIEAIKRAYDKLLETDLFIKTGKYSKYNDQLALELLVAELAQFQI